MSKRANFLFLNVGHFYDHFFTLIFATAAALALTREWNLGYAELIPYATPGFIAFGLFTLPAGWLADKWSREGMMAVFFVGIGASAVATAFAQDPLQMALGLIAIGIFAAIYHPVGIALVVEGREKTGIALAVNGVFGNLGVASAALITGFLIDLIDWRWAFALPGLIALVSGLVYIAFIVRTRHARAAAAKKAVDTATLPRATAQRVFAIVLVATALGGLIFQSVTFAMPKILDERLADLARSATQVGWYTFLVFAIASMAQLLVGTLLDRYSARLVFAATSALQGILFWMMQGLEGGVALIAAVAFMFAVMGQIPITDVLVGRLARGPWRSRVYSVKYVVSFAVSATAVPLIAALYGFGGFDRLFVVLAASAALIFAVVLFLPGGREIVTGQLSPAPEPAE
jgi:MFS family permease